MEIDIQTLNDLIDSKLVMVADKINQNVKEVQESLEIQHETTLSQCLSQDEVNREYIKIQKEHLRRSEDSKKLFKEDLRIKKEQVRALQNIANSLKQLARNK